MFHALAGLGAAVSANPLLSLSMASTVLSLWLIGVLALLHRP